MNPMTCHEVEEQIELFAAGECDAPTEAAIRGHMTGCPRCAKAESEARRFLDLMDVRLQEPDRLQRLLDRIEAESAPKPASIPMTGRATPHRRSVLATRRQWFALAASILLPIGIGIWLTPPAEQPASQQAQSDLTVALLPDRSARGHEKLVAPALANDKVSSEMALTFHLQAEGQSTKKFRSDLVDAAFKGRPTPPPEVDLLLQVHNATDQPMRLLFDDPRAELRLYVSGPGALRLDGPRDADPFGGLRIFDLPASSTKAFSITRLVGGSRRQPVYWYWTEPGDYRLRAVLRAPVQSGSETRMRSIAGPAIPIRVR